MKKFMSLVLMLVLMFNVLGTTCYAKVSDNKSQIFTKTDRGITVKCNNEIINFKDAKLEEAIRKEINKPTGDIHKSDAAEIECLNANDMSISDLDGIQYLTNLKYLFLCGNKINNIDELSKLINLQMIDLGSNSITNISSLSKLINLEYLYLGENQISDISDLRKLINLENLYVWGNQIRDISSLDKLTNLKVLDISYNQVSDITPLKNLTGLKELLLCDNSISDYSPTAEYYNNLDEQDFELVTNNNVDNQQNDISTYTVINFVDTNLESVIREEINKPTGDIFKEDVDEIDCLDANQMSISSLDGIQYLTNLKYLFLWGNKINNIDKLSKLTNLETLFVGNNEITDISPLANLTNLNLLDISHNQVSDITPLKNLTGLKELYLCDNSISNYSPIAGYYKNIDENDFELIKKNNANKNKNKKTTNSSQQNQQDKKTSNTYKQNKKSTNQPKQIKNNLNQYDLKAINATLENIDLQIQILARKIRDERNSYYTIDSLDKDGGAIHSMLLQSKLNLINQWQNNIYQLQQRKVRLLQQMKNKK